MECPKANSFYSQKKSPAEKSGVWLRQKQKTKREQTDMQINKLRAMTEDEHHYYDVAVRLAREICDNEKPKKLYSCKATIYERGNYIVLKSYNTPVALFAQGTHNAVLYDFLRTEYGYTAISAMHISKFKNWLNEKRLLDSTTVYIRYIY